MPNPDNAVTPTPFRENTNNTTSSIGLVSSTSGENRDPPHKLVYMSVAVGIILIVSGLSLLALERTQLVASLMTCVGFGLVLAAFGSTADGVWAKWTVRGAGAFAIILFSILQYYSPPPRQAASYSKGVIEGDLSKIASIRIEDEHPMYQYLDKNSLSIRFLLDRDLKKPRLKIHVITTETEPGETEFILVGDSNAIKERYLTENTNNNLITWDFDHGSRVIKDSGVVIFAEQNSLQDFISPPKESKPAQPERVSLGIFDSIFPKSFAGEKAKVRISARDAVAGLASEDTAIRRNARDILAARGPSAVGLMMDELRAKPTNYRVRLGVVYALSEMLRRAPDQRSAITSVLTDADFPLLVAAASDNDPTIRLQAGEFLYLLQDPRAIPGSTEAARNASDTSKAIDQLQILGQSGQALSDSDKAKILNDLTLAPGIQNSVVGDRASAKQNLGW